ncbi:MAG: 50S ribosomal protein L25 [bacterium]|nr:50S ribosomal protein L25 [bacterium]
MIELKAQNRVELGRRVKVLRKSNLLPGVVYGEGVETTPISFTFGDFEKAHRMVGESSLLKLKVDSKEYNVLIHDISKHPLNGRPIHADFYAVRMDKLLKTKVPFEFIGESPAVKNEGGILVKVMQEAEVEALPQDLPHTIKVDVSLLDKIPAKLTLGDVLLPKGVRFTANSEEVVVLVEPPRSEEELAALKEAPVTAEMTEIKTEKEIKKDLEEKAKAETATDTEAEKK